MNFKISIVAVGLALGLAACDSSKKMEEGSAAYYMQKADELFKSSRRAAAPASELAEPDVWETSGAALPDFEPAGRASFDAETFQKAYDYLNEGVAKYPDFLDMRVGLIQMCYANLRANCMTDAVSRLLERSVENNNNWKFSAPKNIKPGKEAMLDELQNFQFELFKQENDAVVKSNAEKILEYYPDDVASLSTLASIYALEGTDYKKAEALLLKAEKLAPDDAIVLSNLSQVYSYMQNEEKERFYREKSLRAKVGRQIGV